MEKKGSARLSQARYKHRERQRTKQVQAAFDNAVDERESLRSSNRQLEEHQKALDRLNGYATELSDVIAAAKMKAAIGSSGLLPNPAASVAQDIETLVWVHGRQPPDTALEAIKSLPIDVVFKLEKGFRRNLESAYASYQSTYSSRPQLAHVIENAIAVRRQITALISTTLPDLYMRLAADAIVTPTSNDGEKVYRKVLSAVSDFQLSAEQLRKLELAWSRYCDSMQCIERDVGCVSEEVLESDSAGTIEHVDSDIALQHMIPRSNAGLTSRAQHMLALVECVDSVHDWHARRVAALGRLHMEVNACFTWLQFASLQVAAAPFLPDPMHLCSLLLEAGDECCSQ